MKKLLVFFSLCFSTLLLSAQVQTGKASCYSEKFEGRLTASGSVFHQDEAVAAHRYLPFGTIVKVTNLANNKVAYAKITDRGPFVDGRIIDVSRSLASDLDFLENGVTDVVIEVVDKAEAIAASPTKEVTPTKIKTEDKVATLEKEAKAAEQHTEESTPKAEFYEVSLSRISPDGYGVQIGSFQEVANLMRLTDNLKASYGKEVTVQVKNVQEVQIYSIIVGKYDSRKAAEILKNEISDKYPGSFIVNFSELN